MIESMSTKANYWLKATLSTYHPYPGIFLSQLMSYGQNSLLFVPGMCQEFPSPAPKVLLCPQ